LSGYYEMLVDLRLLFRMQQPPGPGCRRSPRAPLSGSLRRPCSRLLLPPGGVVSARADGWPGPDELAEGEALHPAPGLLHWQRWYVEGAASGTRRAPSGWTTGSATPRCGWPGEVARGGGQRRGSAASRSRLMVRLANRCPVWRRLASSWRGRRPHLVRPLPSRPIQQGIRQVERPRRLSVAVCSSGVTEVRILFAFDP